MRIRFMASALGAVVALAVGCGGGPTGEHSSKPATPTVAPTLSPDAIDSLILAPDVASDIVGSKLNWASKPPPGWISPPVAAFADEGNPECEPLIGPDTYSVGVAYTAWRNNGYKEDKDTYDHSVRQAVATVTDAKAATQLLGDAFVKRLDSCGNTVVHLKDDKYRWRFQKTDATGTDARWTATELQDGQVTGWVCANEARAKSNVVIYAQVCQFGNGAPAAATILDKISAKIPG
ncbi:sensor domain-containing protein [Mycobacterium paraseoulense]|uniref:sensor domain-containing protein n=1 Tax=Mycobacterium paraseoulense TaxID=590652 RepID=UPI0009F37B11|nr:sensor domain-containing protein [Mycobacterium paraseoulense]MCV7398312.1 sensor domain-containing protein [Mycobacterium paraseoulense]